jgi:hypothetical protein
MATTTPNYGWDVPTSTDYVKDGATAIETLGDDIDATLWTALGGAYPGLRLVKKQTVGSAVASVTVTGAFSATYENYKILYSGGVGSTNIEFAFSLGGITGSNYYSSLNYSVNTGSTPLAASSNTTSLSWCGAASANTTQFELDIQSPFATKHKTGSSKLIPSAVALNQGSANHYINSATSATAFTITPNVGTITGGNIYVYGYGIS